jgi:hypothetical protein
LKLEGKQTSKFKHWQWQLFGECLWRKHEPTITHKFFYVPHPATTTCPHPVEWTKGRGEAVVVIEEANESIETVRVINTETGTENAVVKEKAKEPTAVTDMMVQMADMVTGIVIAKGTEMKIVSAGAREGTIMKDLNVVTTIKSKEKSRKFLMIFHRHHHHYRLVYPRHLHLMVVLVILPLMLPTNHLWMSHTTLMNRKKMTLKHDLFLFPSSLLA